MKYVLLAALALSVSACGRLSIRTTNEPRPNPQIEALYARGLAHLDPENSRASLDSAAGLLEAYLAYGGHVRRRPEATALLKLTNDSRQLGRVEVALRQARAAGDTATRPAGAEAPATRDGAAVREIERLREELSKANAELERIRRRLAAPRPPAV